MIVYKLIIIIYLNVDMLLENHNLTLVNEISENLKILQECDLNRDRSKEMIASSIYIHINIIIILSSTSNFSSY